MEKKLEEKFLQFKKYIDNNLNIAVKTVMVNHNKEVMKRYVLNSCMQTAFAVAKELEINNPFKEFGYKKVKLIMRHFYIDDKEYAEEKNLGARNYYHGYVELLGKKDKIIIDPDNFSTTDSTGALVYRTTIADNKLHFWHTTVRVEPHSLRDTENTYEEFLGMNYSEFFLKVKQEQKRASQSDLEVTFTKGMCGLFEELGIIFDRNVWGD